MKHNIWKTLISIILVCASSVIAFSRYYLGYHTSKQVIVGICLGIVSGTTWYCLVEYVFRPYLFKPILEHPISKFLLLHDSASIPNIFVWEYEQNKLYIQQHESGQIKSE